VNPVPERDGIEGDMLENLAEKHTIKLALDLAQEFPARETVTLHGLVRNSEPCRSLRYKSERNVGRHVETRDAKAE
jgi:hypothetical protein